MYVFFDQGNLENGFMVVKAMIFTFTCLSRVISKSKKKKKIVNLFKNEISHKSLFKE